MTARMSASDMRMEALIAMSEDDFERDLRQLSKRLKWWGYHTRDSRGSEPGYPDWTLARAGRVIIAELKAVRGRWGQGQCEWLAALAGDSPDEWHFDREVAVSDQLLVACWTPLSWDRITEVLL